MDNDQTGKIIAARRKALGLTQEQLAQQLNVTDKAVSKWERGAGLPDISILQALSGVLNIEISVLLNGCLPENEFVGGNMKKSKFYVCGNCQSLTICTGNASVCCCGNRLPELTAKKADENEKLKAEEIDNEWYITGEHQMTKEHYVSFIAFLSGGRLQVIKQYPEWSLQARIPKSDHGLLLWYCTQHGLFYQNL